MVAGVARVPGAAGRPPGLRHASRAVSARQAVERGQRGSGQNPFSLRLSRTTTCNGVYDAALLRADDRGLVSHGGMPTQVNRTTIK